jgi:hypothetical protein
MFISNGRLLQEVIYCPLATKHATKQERLENSITPPAKPTRQNSNSFMNIKRFLLNRKYVGRSFFIKIDFTSYEFRESMKSHGFSI